MPEDYYDQEEDMGSESEESASPEASQRGASEGGETALIPKSLLAGKEFQPGEEVVFQIVHIYEDEVEIQYATYEPKKEKGSSPMEESESQLDEMAVSGEGGGY